MYLQLHSLLGVDRKLILRTSLTAAGNVLICPVSEEAKNQLLAADKLPENLVLKDLSNRISSGKASPFVVLRGVHPEIDVADISAELGLPCSRLLSAANEGKPTMKVKVKCLDEAKRRELLSGGATVGLEHFKVSAYEGDSAPALQCYTCLGIGHLAKSCAKEKVCRKCGGSHLAEDCQAEQLSCTNCHQAHSATDPSCPLIISHKENKEAKTLSYAAAAMKGADKPDSLRLATAIASALAASFKRANITLTPAEICSDVAISVSKAYKVNIKPAFIQHHAFSAASTPSIPPHHG